MKTAVKQITRKPVSTKKEKRPAATHIRPQVITQSNHAKIQNDKWERQAQQAADRIMRGEKGVARLLTPASAARKKVPSSRGEHLPDALRAELEQGFDADLAVVRIHRDAGAHAEVVAENAKAFTSGSHIYFAHGMFDPASKAGQNLLNHELAHVLQQTGRTGHGGVVHATDVSGCGDIQFAPWPSFKELRALHRKTAAVRAASEVKSKGDTKSYDTLADEIQKIVKNKTNLSADPTIKSNLSNLADLKRPGMAVFPAEAESLLYDTLKAAGLTEKAVELLERDDFDGAARIRTVLRDKNIEAHLQAISNAKTMDTVLGKLAASKFAWNFELRRITHEFLFQPSGKKPSPLDTRRPPYNAQDYRKLDKYKSELQTELEDNTKLSENEWNLVALTQLAHLDVIQNNVFVEAENEAIDARHTSDFSFKKHRIEALKKIFTKKQEKPGENLAHKVFVERIKLQLMKVVDRALAVFKAIEVDLEQAVKLKGLESLVKAVRHAEFHKRTAVLKSNLRSLAKALDDHGKDGLFPPTRTSYPAKCAEFAQKFREEGLKSIDKRLWGFFWRSKNIGKQDTDREILMGLLITYTVAEGIVRKLDAAKNRTGLDARNLHFIYLARRGRNLAVGLKWNKLADEFRTALRPKARTLIALKGEWILQRRSSVTGMLEDFNPDSRIIGREYMTFRQLAQLLQVQYYSNLKSSLDALLPKDKDFKKEVGVASVEQHYMPAMNLAADMIKDDMPTRYGPTGGSEVALARETKNKSKVQASTSCWGATDRTARFACVLADHPVIDNWIKSEAKQMRGILLPHTPGKGVFAWSYPALTNVAKVLSDNKLLQSIVEAELKRLKVSRKESDLRKIPEHWLFYLKLAVRHFLTRVKKKGTEGEEARRQLREIMQSVGTETATKRSESWKQFRESQFKALTFHRETIVKRTLKKYLQNYAENRLRHWSAPEEVLRQIKGFQAPQPATDAPKSFHKTQTEQIAGDNRLQLAVLMLQIAPEMRQAFKWERRVDLLRGYLGPLRDAESSYRKNFAKVHRLAKEHYPARDKDWMAKNFKCLQWVLQHFETTAKRFQVSRGMIADKDKGVVYSTTSAFAIPIGQKIPLHGKYYTIHSIKNSFEFHPAFGLKPENPSATSSYNPKILKDPNTNFDLPDKLELLVYSISNKRQEQGPKKTLTGHDEHILEQLSEALVFKAFSITMQQIEKVMESYVEVWSWVPGYGQLVDLSRALAALKEFFDTGAYEEVKKVLNGGLKEVLNNFLADAEKALQPENLILFLLFGDPVLDQLLAQANEVQNKPGKPSGRKPGKFAAAGRVINGLKRLAYGVIKALDTLHGRVQVPMQGLRVFVISHPRVATVFHLAEAHIYRLTLIKNPPVLTNDMKVELGDRFDTLIKGLGRLELPDRVMDITPVIQVVLAELSRFVGKKLGVKGRLVTGLLDLFGAVNWATGKIAEVIIEKGFDPNAYWRKTVKPRLRIKFDNTRRDMVASLQHVMSSQHLGAPAKIAAADPSAFESYDGEFKETYVAVDAQKEVEAQPYAKHGAPQLTQRVELPEVSGGRALTRFERTDLEARFGHDFSHVRLHTGLQGHEMSEATGAAAITSGSHIYLRPGLSTQMGQGRNILYHELAHVLQQTGARPLGMKHDARPMAGRPGIGIRIDPQQEQAAEAAADFARAGDQNMPVEFGEEGEKGLQPALPFHLIGRILDELSSVEKIEKKREALESRLDSEAKKARAPKKTKQLKQTILALVKALENSGIPTAFTSVKDAITGRLKPTGLALSTVAHLIAADSLDSKPLKGRGISGKRRGKKDRVTFVNLPRFATQFQEYILARTGIVVNFDWNLTPGEPNTSQLVFHKEAKVGKGKNLKASKPVTKIEVVHIHLPFITRSGEHGKTLWNAIINAHWGVAATHIKNAPAMSFACICVLKGRCPKFL